MSANVQFTVKEYFVNNIAFRMNPAFDFKSPHRMVVEPVYQRSFRPLSDDDVWVELAILVHEGKSPLPFTLDASVSVLIHSERWAETPQKRAFILDTGATIIFPYLRALVTNVSGTMNYLPYTPPFMNIVALLNEQEKKTVSA